MVRGADPEPKWRHTHHRRRRQRWVLAVVLAAAAALLLFWLRTLGASVGPTRTTLSSRSTVDQVGRIHERGVCGSPGCPRPTPPPPEADGRKPLGLVAARPPCQPARRVPPDAPGAARPRRTGLRRSGREHQRASRRARPAGPGLVSRPGGIRRALFEDQSPDARRWKDPPDRPRWACDRAGRKRRLADRGHDRD